MNQSAAASNDPLRLVRPRAPLRPLRRRCRWNDPSQRTPLMILGGLVLLLVVAYWDMFALTSAAWSEGLYSHGWIVPLFALGCCGCAGSRSARCRRTSAGSGWGCWRSVCRRG